MSCSPFDLKDYFLRELSAPERNQVEAHVRACSGCREELERLQVAEAALFSLRDEEIPQRIAFVSDKIFEPSGWRRAWSAFWGSPARLGFASAAMLSAALVVFTLVRPAIRPMNSSSANVSAAEIQQQIQTAVNRAVAESEARQEKKTGQLVRDLELRNQQERQRLMQAAAMEFDFLTRRDRPVITAGAYNTGSGETK